MLRLHYPSRSYLTTAMVICSRGAAFYVPWSLQLGHVEGSTMLIVFGS